MSNTSLDAAISPFVLAIDVGSSSVRALLFDAHARQIDATEHQTNYTLETTPDGGSTAPPDTLIHLVVQCIDRTLASAGELGDQIAAVGMTTFWHGLLGLDACMSPTTPVLMWADTRSGPDARSLALQHPTAGVHHLTGCRFHSSYWPAKLRWLQRADPETFVRTACWVSFADYLTWVLHGEMVTSISMASGSGMLGSATIAWSGDVATMAGIRVEQLPPLIDRDAPLPPLRETWGKRWPALAAATWFPAIGDGATANVGAYCVGPDRIALTIGTSGAMRIIVDDEAHARISPGLWRYRLDRHSAVIGGALSNGGNILSWLADLTGDQDFDALTAEASAIPPDGHGLTVLPLLAGERSPSWDDRFGGTISGLRLDTTAGAIFRAFLEATGYRLASIYDGLVPIAIPEHEIFASGGAILRSPLWMQIVADTLGHDLFALDPRAEASARGAAICALHSIGAIASVRLEPDASIETYTSNPARRQLYVDARARLERLESALATLEPDLTLLSSPRSPR